MSLNENEKKYMKKFIEYLESNPFVGHQEQCGRDKDYWNADMWTVQVSKCLYYGDKYSTPENFKDNRNYSVNEIRSNADMKLSMKKILEDIKDSADCILVCESGRLLDGIMANMVKSWKKIYCYDHVDYRKYYPKDIFDNIDFVVKNTGVFSPESISDKCIVLMNHSIHPYDKFKKYTNSVHGIINGELKW